MYTYNDKMADLMSSDPHALQIISRFRLPLGVGDKTIQDVCRENNVHTSTFLTLVNYKPGCDNCIDYNDLSLPTLMEYLRQAHAYFFNFSLPMLRRKLIEAINYSVSDSKIPMLIIRFFDEYVNEVSLHMQHENEQLFPYVEKLLEGEKGDGFNIEIFAHQHRAVDDQHIADKLTELKNLIVKYYPQTDENDLLISALSDLFQVESALDRHCTFEDEILLPAVRLLEQRYRNSPVRKKKQEPTEELSDREKDVLVEVVKGLSNKEIADVLCISIHTVISHRKNISRKLNIHSPAGLTIYAIVNNLVDLDEFKDNL
ncbi:MAG: helix-turn-helix transcriptional regulator [Paludibacteraceae bacterium]|nr:helix-turn-helix transcriptional regulator [Paludibacteraceae bacterium]MBQ9704919.1 helix-turn-helix transcriptional regulator [Paludibacteraceae bacterium]